MVRSLQLLILMLILGSCQKELPSDINGQNSEPVAIQFVGRTGPLQLEQGVQYTNQHGEAFTVGAFRFYIHDLKLVNTISGAESALDRNTYHLIDALNGSQGRVAGLVTPGEFNAISFVLGVDSLYNVSGAQDGALDPLNGMFWTWNTGYIMAKLEGNTPVANTPNNAFQYHIGGFSGAYNVVRRITVPLPGQGLDTENFSNPQVVVHCDVLKWFEGPETITLTDNPVCMTPGELAARIARNYYNMFSVSSIEEVP